MNPSGFYVDPFSFRPMKIKNSPYQYGKGICFFKNGNILGTCKTLVVYLFPPLKTNNYGSIFFHS